MSFKEIQDLWSPFDANRMPRMWLLLCYGCGDDIAAGDVRHGKKYVGGVKTYSMPFDKDLNNMCIICKSCYSSTDIIEPPSDVEDFKKQQEKVRKMVAVMKKATEIDERAVRLHPEVKAAKARLEKVQTELLSLQGQLEESEARYNEQSEQYQRELVEEKKMLAKLDRATAAIYGMEAMIEELEQSQKMQEMKTYQNRKRIMINLRDSIDSKQMSVKGDATALRNRWIEAARLFEHSVLPEDVIKKMGEALANQVMRSMSVKIDEFVRNLQKKIKIPEFETEEIELDEGTKRCLTCTKIFEDSELLLLGCGHQEMCQPCWEKHVRNLDDMGLESSRMDMYQCPMCRKYMQRDGSQASVSKLEKLRLRLAERGIAL